MSGNESSGSISRHRRTVWPRRALALVIMLALAAPLIACRPGAVSLQDYQRDILSVGMAAVLDWVIPVRERTITEGDHTMRNMHEARPIPRNDTPTESARARIEPEDDDLSFTCSGASGADCRHQPPRAASSSSEMSMSE